MSHLLLALSLWLAPASALEPPPLPGEPLGAWSGLEDGRARDAALTPDEAVALALAANGDLLARFARVERARGEASAAGALPDLAVELGLIEAHGDRRVGVGRVGVEAALTEALLAPIRGRAARAEWDGERLHAAAAAVRLGYQVRAAFHQAQAAEARYLAAMRAVEAWAAGAEAARALYEAGNIPELDLAVQESEYERARVLLAELELDLVARRERLNRLVGQELQRPLTPLAADVDPDLHEIQARAVAASLDILASEAGIRSANGMLTVARAHRLPSVGAYLEGERQGEAWGAEAGLHVTLPSVRRTRGEVVAQAAERDARAAERAQLEAEVRSAAREVRARVTSARDRARHVAEVVLPAHRRVSRQTLLHYNAMQLGIFQLLEARRLELEAEVALAEVLAEAAMARAELQALLAGARVEPVRASPRLSTSPGPSAPGGH